jgi:hypothetical protein
MITIMENFKTKLASNLEKPRALSYKYRISGGESYSLVPLGLKSDELILPGKKPRCFGGTKVGLSTCSSQLKPRAEEAEASRSAEWVLKSV